MHRNDKQNVLKRTVLAAAMASALCAVPFAAHAAGMGKITVLSALGQPLRAELDITASREEMGSLAARVAPIEAFRQANVEYAGVLSSVKFVLDKRADGRPYFRIQTERVVNDPFIDFLVELSWSSGRLVREYAFLLDPPELKSDATTAAVAPPVVPAQAESASSGPVPEAPPPVESAPKSQKKSTASSPAKVPKVAAEAGDEGGNTRIVKSGDTLGKIAAEHAADGITLDQMLVALFNSNRGAFDGGNMNRLRAGKILTIPDASAAAAIGAGEARKTVVAQSADFNAYRNSLAASAAKQAPVGEPTEQSTAGKITPKVADNAPAATGKDRLQVSRSEGDTKAGKSKAAEEDAIARDKALKEANARVAELEKNLSDLKKLAELKSQAAADAQKTAQAANAAPATPPAVVKPADVPPSQPSVTVAATPPAASATAAAPEAPAAVSATAAAPADEQPKPKPKKKFVPPPPEPEPSFIDDNPLIVYGGGAVLAAILGFLGFRIWKRKRDGNQSITVSDLAASSVFGAVASESVDTNAAAAASDFGHSTLDAVDASVQSVDPIQEAEVYMAYGRDGQAEEILVDALQKDSGNHAVRLKLLEIYAGRKSIPQFNEVAQELHLRTGGSGSDWDKAAALGRTLDPDNSLYGGTASIPAHEQTITTAATPAAESMQATMIMDAPPAQEAPAAAVAVAPASAPVEEIPSVMDFDLDLGGPDETPAATTTSLAAAEPAATGLDMDFDLDLGGSPAAPVEGTAEAGNTIDFDIGSPAAPVAANPPSAPAPQAAADTALDFDFDLGSDGAPAPLEPSSPPLDLSAINLDLDQPAAPAAGAAADSAEVATKLELAQAYEEMGDREGARELLQEVLAEGSSAQQEIARGKLAQLG